MSQFTLRERAFGWLMIHRPFMLILVVLGSLVGYLLVTFDRGIPINATELSFGLVAVLFVCAGVDVIHEVLDKEVDAINKPYRPMPRGLVGEKAAIEVAFVEFSLGLVLGLVVSWWFVLFLLFIIALTTHYSLWGKFQPFFGQLESTVGSAMVPYSGAVIHGDLLTILPLAIFIFLFEVGRWFMVNVEDLEADLARGRTTVHVLGRKVSLWLGLAFYLGALLFTALPWFHQGFSPLYEHGSGIFALSLVAFWIISHVYGHDEGSLHRWHRNIARVAIVLYQIVLVVEVFV